MNVHTKTTAATGPAARASATLERLAALHPKLIDLGLERSHRLLKKLGNPETAMPPTIHIAGTNGKGSVLAFLAAMFTAAKKTTHAYTSPHLVRFNERIRLTGELISDDALAALLEEVERINGDEPVTFFEITTAAAMLAFARTPADITLLEVGLGGRMDSTNVVPADRTLASVITPIARDHEHFLGDTITAIASEKAGIMREATPVLCAMQETDAIQVITEKAQEVGAPLYIAGRDFGFTIAGKELIVEIADRHAANRNITIPHIGLIGRHQQENCALAAATIMHIMPDIPDAAIIEGAATANWPGRITRLEHGNLADIAGDIPLWLDGAHNSHGAHALARALADMDSDKFVLICGALNTRDPKEFLAPLAPHLGHVITMTIPESEAALTAGELRRAAEKICDVPVETAANITDAARRAAAAMADKKNAAIIISGSLYLAGHALSVNGTNPD